MTPARALDIWVDCKENEDGDWQSEAMNRIIRAAEDDALERAANVELTQSNGCPLLMAQNWRAAILALKHPR